MRSDIHRVCRPQYSSSPLARRLPGSNNWRNPLSPRVPLYPGFVGGFTLMGTSLPSISVSSAVLVRQWSTPGAGTRLSRHASRSPMH